MSRYVIGFRMGDDGTTTPVSIRANRSTVKGSKSRAAAEHQQQIGFQVPDAAVANRDVTLGELEALKELLRRDHAKRKRKHLTDLEQWCACGFYGLVDYDGVDRACAALNKLTQAKSATPAPVPNPQPTDKPAVHFTITPTSRFEVWVSEDHISIQEPLAFGRVASGVDIPVTRAGEVIEKLRRALGEL